MHLQYRLTVTAVRQPDVHPTVKPAGTQQGRIQHIGTVGGRQHNDILPLFKAIHLHQNLVECLLALVMPAAHAGTAAAPHGVNLVNKDNARGVFLSLGEQIAHPASANTDKHLHELRAGNAEERRVGFPGHRPREHRLTGSRRADQQHSFGDAGVQRLELFRKFQEFHDFFQILLSLVRTSDVFENDFLFLVAVQPGLAFPEAQRLIALPLSATHHKEQHTTDNKYRQNRNADTRPSRAGATGRLVLHRYFTGINARFVQTHRRVTDRADRRRFLALFGNFQAVSGYGNLLNLIIIDLLDDFGKRLRAQIARLPKGREDNQTK